MSEIQQVVLDKAELSKIVLQHFAARFPEGLVINGEVFFVGSPPKTQGRAGTTRTTRQGIAERYLNGAKPAEQDGPPVLQEVGAIVILNPRPKAPAG